MGKLLLAVLARNSLPGLYSVKFNMAATATSEVGALKSFFEDVLNKTETLISEDHPVATSDLLLHVNLLEKGNKSGNKFKWMGYMSVVTIN